MTHKVSTIEEISKCNWKNYKSCKGKLKFYEYIKSHSIREEPFSACYRHFKLIQGYVKRVSKKEAQIILEELCALEICEE